MSATSAERFAARNRARRWEGLRPLLTLVVVLVLAGGAAWVVYGSPYLRVDRVEVSGTRELRPQEVLDAAAVRIGKPLARLDSDAVRGRVGALPRVRDVQVVRRWPHAVRIVVAERQTGAVLHTGAGYALVDTDGVTFLAVPAPPKGVPVIRAEGTRPSTATLGAAVQVVRALPPGLAARVVTVRARTPDAVVLDLTGGVSVMWGGASEPERKAQVLAALMKQRARVYDVSAPEAPTIRATL